MGVPEPMGEAGQREEQRRERKSQSSTPSGPAHVITVKGQDATPWGRPEGQRQQCSLSSQYTLTLSPGPGDDDKYYKG